MKTSELIGTALDWAVAKCEGLCESGMRFDPKDSEYRSKVSKAGLFWNSGYHKFSEYRPSTNWSQGGPIIEREKIDLKYYGYDNPPYWGAVNFSPSSRDRNGAVGPTPLITAMRCFVASRLGNEVEIPKELL